QSSFFTARPSWNQSGSGKKGMEGSLSKSGNEAWLFAIQFSHGSLFGSKLRNSSTNCFCLGGSCASLQNAALATSQNRAAQRSLCGECATERRIAPRRVD